MTKIKNLPKDKRPREKLILNGADTLTNTELLSIILGVGTKKEDVSEISNKIFPSYKINLKYSSFNPNLLSKSLDIPITHACKIASFHELARRVYASDKDEYIHTPHDVYLKLKQISKFKKENLIAIYLNTRSKIIHEETITIGTTTSSLISNKDILEPAVKYMAAYLIIVHNHPSGDPNWI